MRLLRAAGDPRLAGRVLPSADLEHAVDDLLRVTGVPPAIALDLP
jgi:hypothetical protein